MHPSQLKKLSCLKAPPEQKPLEVVIIPEFNNQ